VPFASELESVLPLDLPERDRLVDLGARHLERIDEANRHFNLTRIVTPRDAAIKHVLDSVLPWRFFAGAAAILDAGTGAGFPGIPLAIILPGQQFTLVESIGKKARFVAEAIEALELTNATVVNARAEEYLREAPPILITGRAVAPLPKACDLFGPAIRAGSRALLYKGRDIDTEIEAATPEARKHKLKLSVLARYELPESSGLRTLVQMSSHVP
jgi:16S rRNA (guanine527-N7)-methyltransferase